MARSLSVTLLSLTLGLGATWIGTQGVGEVPPLGALLSPSSGLWSNAADDLPASATAKIPALSDAVEIRYDARSVPHIFAKTDEDAARALGYVVARDRLFQLEVQSRAGEGTLTELVGDVALPADQQTRRLGMSRAAEKQFAALDTAGPLYRTLRAYAEGINAYRTSLSSAQLPMEYKLLQKTPREWLPLHSMNLLMRMGFTLAHAPIELDLLQARALVGDSAARAMWDASSPVQEPIQPAPRNAPRDALVPLPAPGTPSVEATRMLTAMGMGSGPLRWGSDSALSADDRYALQQERAFASNNWAVAPSRCRTGRGGVGGANPTRTKPTS
ncbi:penicillin acylase family protein, partial [Gemmatimonas sp.]|uniref:penicillin acylase family protein n=1 Tax=Gemmatimonas sp. TaxID=1962908 RepID=UPI00391D791D